MTGLPGSCYALALMYAMIKGRRGQRRPQSTANAGRFTKED